MLAQLRVFRRCALLRFAPQGFACVARSGFAVVIRALSVAPLRSALFFISARRARWGGGQRALLLLLRRNKPAFAGLFLNVWVGFYNCHANPQFHYSTPPQFASQL